MTIKRGRRSGVADRPPPIRYPDGDGKPLAENEPTGREVVRVRATIDAALAGNPTAYVGMNSFIYYEEDNRKAVVAPDVFVVFGVPKAPPRDSFFTWQEGAVPAFTLEVTSRSTRRVDQVRKRQIYAQMGVREYVLYDWRAEWLRPSLQLLRLAGAAYTPVEPEPDGSLISETLGLRLRLVEGRLRFFDRATGEQLLSADEAVPAEVAARQQAEARAVAEALAREQAEARARAAEQRIAALEAELRRRDDAYA